MGEDSNKDLSSIDIDTESIEKINVNEDQYINVNFKNDQFKNATIVGIGNKKIYGSIKQKITKNLPKQKIIDLLS